jgi:hypothetical protein
MCSDRKKAKPDTGQKKTYYTTDNFFGAHFGSQLHTKNHS